MGQLLINQGRVLELEGVSLVPTVGQLSLAGNYELGFEGVSLAPTVGQLSLAVNYELGFEGVSLVPTVGTLELLIGDGYPYPISLTYEIAREALRLSVTIDRERM